MVLATIALIGHTDEPRFSQPWIFFCGMWCGWIFVKSRKKSTCATIVVRGRTVWKSNADVRNSPWFVTATSTVHSDDVPVPLTLLHYSYSLPLPPLYHRYIFVRRFYSPVCTCTVCWVKSYTCTIEILENETSFSCEKAHPSKKSLHSKWT